MLPIFFYRLKEFFNNTGVDWDKQALNEKMLLNMLKSILIKSQQEY